MKPFSSMNNQELSNAVDEKKALPDMILKRHIFDAQKVMINAHSRLLLNAARNSNRVKDLDIFELKSAVINLFGLIGEMARENGYLNLIDKSNSTKTDYDYMEDLMYLKPLHSNKSIDLKILIRLMQYNLNLLHRLNLTNLLIDNDTNDNGTDTY